MYPTRFFPPRYFSPGYWPPGPPARGSKVVPLPPRVEAGGAARPVSTLQLVRPVRMVPVVMIDESTAPVFEHYSGLLGPFGNKPPNAPPYPRYPITQPPPAAGDVEVLVQARADLGDETEFVRLSFNWLAYYVDLFVTTGHDCPDTPDEVRLILSAAEWAGVLAVGNGNVTVRIQPYGPVDQDPLLCTGDTWVSVLIRYTEDVVVEHTPPYMTWRSESEVLLGDGSMGYLWGEWAYDPVTGAMIVVVPSATLHKVTLAGLNIGGRDGTAPAFTCSDALYEVRGVVVRFSGAGSCIMQ